MLIEISYQKPDVQAAHGYTIQRRLVRDEDLRLVDAHPTDAAKCVASIQGDKTFGGLALGQLTIVESLPAFTSRYAGASAGSRVVADSRSLDSVRQADAQAQTQAAS